ncbi:MAG: hypothetical protein JNN15_16190, partial [Blastocatellia bacterium]|nr:hypothetical protein [Blastocatellia bacterium]
MKEKLSEQNVELLKKHLHALVQVEFFTIPFYLTAVYSFTNKALNYTSKRGKTPLSNMQNRALSVAVEEMYHLQLASNLNNAFNVVPEVPKLKLVAGETITVPHLEDQSKPLTTKLGNLAEVIAAMLEVEKPDPKKKFPPPNEAVVYPAISDLYHATLDLLSRYFKAFELTPAALDPHFTPNHNQISYGA